MKQATQQLVSDMNALVNMLPWEDRGPFLYENLIRFAEDYEWWKDYHHRPGRESEDYEEAIEFLQHCLQFYISDKDHGRLDA